MGRAEQGRAGQGNSVTCLSTNCLTADAVVGAKSQIMRKAVQRLWLTCTAVDRSSERRLCVQKQHNNDDAV